ncbi:hypothetical protein LTR29_002165 [Friedmanniomyces endolithicus]|nr:hypothetical protein LTR29_002165 [Friedmanniomyces endolithicus]
MATIGATVHTTPLGIGRYHVNQVDSLLTSRTPPSLRPNQEPFGFLAGPINIMGYVDSIRLLAVVTLSVFGLTLGTFTGVLKDGLHVDFHLQAATGSITLYLKHSTSELRVRGLTISEVDWYDGFAFDERLLFVRLPTNRLKTVRRQSLTLMLQKGNDLASRLRLLAEDFDMRGINILMAVLGLALSVDSKRAPSPPDITITNLTAQHFPELGSQRVKVAYGSHVVQSKSEEDGMSKFQAPIPPPCTDCLVTFMQAQLEYADGTVADAATGMWMHHVVFLNRGRNDSLCGRRGQRFFASGNERTAVDFTSTFSAAGTQHLGYPILANESFFIVGELMNMLQTPQEVVFSMIWEFLPSPPPYFRHAVPYWLDVGGCGGSDVPAKAASQYDYTSPVVTASSHGEIALIAGHLHDGGTHLDVFRNGETVCNMPATYDSSKDADHIARIDSCTNDVVTAPGDEWFIRAYYDTSIHAPMASNDGSLEPVMGIALAYVVASEPVSGSWISREMLVLVVVAAVIATGLAALYVVRQKPAFFTRLLADFRAHGWERVRTDDPEGDDVDGEEGVLLRRNEGRK